MDRFTGDIDDLVATATTLTELQSRLSSVTGSVNGVYDHYEDPQLVRRMHDFSSHWTWGAQKIAAQMESTAKDLGEIINNYEMLEDHNVGLARAYVKAPSQPSTATSA